VPRRPFTATEEEAGGREHFEDAALYDYEYRRRRADVNFYRRLCADRAAMGPPGPLLDLACGTGRLMIPLLRDGHQVIGLDRAPAMLARAHGRLRRLSAARRAHALLVRGDLRALPLRRERRAALALCAFHSLQHLLTDEEILGFLAGVRDTLAPGGWLAFDVLPPDPAWLERDPSRRWARTVFRHPTSKERLVYSTNHLYDSGRRVLHMRLYYQPIDERGRPRGAERVVRLSHRQLSPTEIERLLARAGFSLLASFGGFDGRALPPGDGLPADEHVYVTRTSH
jgi:SAM-dependent methyltransferase